MLVYSLCLFVFSSVTDVFLPSIFLFGYVTAKVPAFLFRSFFNFKNTITAPTAPPPRRSKTIITTAATTPGASPRESEFAFNLIWDAPELGSADQKEMENVVGCDADEVIFDVNPE